MLTSVIKFPLIAVVSLGLAMVQTAPQGPLTQDEVRQLIKNNKKEPDVVFRTLDERGVNFDLDRNIEAKMRNAGADDLMLQAIWKAGPTSRSARSATLTSATGVPLQATYEEAMGFQTLQNELDPDRRVRMAEEFERRFPNSQLLSYVYAQVARAYGEKGDLDRLVEYGEKSLKLDPDNLFSIVMVAVAVSQPRMLRIAPSVAAQRLATAENYAHQALQLLESLPKRANETDEQLEKRKSALAADAHTALALVHMHRDELSKAIEELRTAISLSEGSNPQLYFRLGEAYADNGKKAEAIEAFTKASELGRGTALQKHAEERIQALKK